MAYSGIIKPSANFNTLAYTANGTNPRTITGLGHQPGWLWFKSRESGAIDHATWDVVALGGDAHREAARRGDLVYELGRALIVRRRVDVKVQQRMARRIQRRELPARLPR